MREWKKKFELDEVTLLQIQEYITHHSTLMELCNTLSGTASLLVDCQTAEGSKQTFLRDFRSLNLLLLKCVPQQPGLNWCSFLALIKEYGVTLPQLLLIKVEKYVVFPDDENIRMYNPLEISDSPSLPKNKLSKKGISLRLKQNLSVKELSKLVHELEEFQKPLMPYLTMFVFFKLNPCTMFDKYLRAEIKKEVTLKRTKKTKTSLPHRPLRKFRQASVLDQSGVSITVLEKALNKTKQLLTMLMQGEAPYSDIIANGELDLEELNIEKEFNTLKEYTSVTPDSQIGLEGLTGVRNLLELFQYAKHIQTIHDVCEQYHLVGCLEDEALKKVVTHVGKGHHSELTPNIARARMKLIKELLCINRDGETESKAIKRSASLEVFYTVANSTEFYQFIHDKQFYGEKGQATFQQQYQLITAQLQHEEYDESVLNHLLAAFNVMTPFMDDKQTFKELMTKVTDLDTTFRLRELETINRNITLIQLWFSRAEVSTCTV